MNLTSLLAVLCVITIPFNSSAESKNEIQAEESQFRFEKRTLDLEYQIKNLNNSSDGKDYGDDWDSEQAQQVFGIFNFDLKYKHHHLKINTFLRHTQTKLYQNENSPALFYALAPQRLIPRELAKINYEKENKDSKQEIVFNHLTYDWGDDEINFSVGRMTIVYGEGFTINPINPFNHNLAPSNFYGVDQGNDGFKFTLQKDPKLKLNFFFLGDKAFTDYDDKITRTIMLRGDWDKSNTMKITYIIGEDQNRHKYGFEIKKSFINSFVFGQLVNFTRRLDNKASTSHGLSHYLLGYEQDIQDKWTMRAELGQFSIDADVPLNDPGTYLPFQSILAIYNSYRFNDKWDSELGFVSDRASTASYYKISIGYKHNKNITGRLFSSGLSNQAEDNNKYLAQKFIPSEIGAALRVSF